MFIFRCGGKSDLTSEDRERSNPRWPPVHRVLCSNTLNFRTKQCRKTFKVSFPTKLGMPIHLVILLIARTQGHAFRSRSNYVKYLFYDTAVGTAIEKS